MFKSAKGKGKTNGNGLAGLGEVTVYRFGDKLTAPQRFAMLAIKKGHVEVTTGVGHKGRTKVKFIKYVEPTTGAHRWGVAEISKNNEIYYAISARGRNAAYAIFRTVVEILGDESTRR